MALLDSRLYTKWGKVWNQMTIFKEKSIMQLQTLHQMGQSLELSMAS